MNLTSALCAFAEIFFCFACRLVSFVPMLILHSFVLESFLFQSVYYHLSRLVVFLLIKNRYFIFADDFLAFESAFGLVSQFCAPF